MFPFPASDFPQTPGYSAPEGGFAFLPPSAGTIVPAGLASHVLPRAGTRVLTASCIPPPREVELAIATNSAPGPALLRPEPEEPPEPRERDGRGPGPVPADRPAGHHPPRWWREIALIVIFYAAYTATRGLTDSDASSTNSTGHTLLRWETSWHLAPERTLNQLLWHLPPLAVAASYFYATLHYVATPAVLVWVYRRHPASYRAARTALGVATVLGLAGFCLLPTTPPRLLPGGGFHDTLATVSSWGWWGGQASAPRGLGALTNQYAAMPSLHVGWALWSGWLLARHARRRTIRAAGALYPVLTTLVVMATANHYLLDAVAGIADVALAAGAVAILGRPARVPHDSPPPAQIAARPAGTASATPAGRDRREERPMLRPPCPLLARTYRGTLDGNGRIEPDRPGDPAPAGTQMRAWA